MGARYEKIECKRKNTGANLHVAIKIGVNMKLFFNCVRELDLMIFSICMGFSLVHNGCGYAQCGMGVENPRSITH
jgi:hypothetical protein